MVDIFGDTPLGILILDAIGLTLIPLLVAVFRRLGAISTNLTDCVKALTVANTSLAGIISELNDARVRDKDIEGRLKGIDRRLETIERK